MDLIDNRYFCRCYICNIKFRYNPNAEELGRENICDYCNEVIDITLADMSFQDEYEESGDV